MSVHLIIQYFRVNRDQNKNDYNILCKRQEEYTHCLKKNIENKDVKYIHVLLENEDDYREMQDQGIDVNDGKLRISTINKRMFFSDAFRYANQELKNEVVIVLHSDIYLEKGFDMIDKEKMDKKMYALARSSNVDGKDTGRGIRIKKIPGEQGEYCCTFDGYCFLSPLPEEIVNNANHQQNVWGSENRLVCIFKKNGYEVTTPNVLKMVHWHKTDIRPNQNWNWIMENGDLIPHNDGEFTRKYQKNNPNIVGGLIPIKLGTSKMVNNL